MEWPGAPDYWLARFLLERGLALTYLLAFLSAANQFPVLVGERGLLPIGPFLAVASARQSPSLFHLRYSDPLLRLTAWLGAAVALSLLLGLPQRGPASVPMAAWALLWLLYLSIVNVGQIFYAFGWETLLLEVGFLAIWLGPADQAPPMLLLWLFRWLLFRLEFGAGLIKLRGDPCWRDLTCLYYHHETQPLPGPLSWHFHHLPRALHRVEVAANHFAQLAVPFGLFLPQPMASVAGTVIVVTQLWLMASGNFSWLNFITVVLAAAAFHDGALELVLPVTAPELTAIPAWHAGAVVALTLLVAGLSWRPAKNLVSRRQLMNASFEPLGLVNTYGAFGSITKTRYEVVVEGTADPSQPDGWREYRFKAKPGDLSRRPPQVAPYHLRLDWLMWFLPLSPPTHRSWFVPLLHKLLDGDAAVLGLLGHNPFPDAPPRQVRALVYRYRFTTRAERRHTGQWWDRTSMGEMVPPLSRE